MPSGVYNRQKRGKYIKMLPIRHKTTIYVTDLELVAVKDFISKLRGTANTQAKAQKTRKYKGIRKAVTLSRLENCLVRIFYNVELDCIRSIKITPYNSNMELGKPKEIVIGDFATGLTIEKIKTAIKNKVGF
jgi:hypothetical protein